MEIVLRGVRPDIEVIAQIADSVTAFSRRHGFTSGDWLYRCWAAGEGPPFLLVGRQRFITRDAGEAWWRQYERAMTGRTPRRVAAG